MAFKGYAAILIWIQLWPPLYAILNYMASIYAAYDLAAAADLGTGAKALALQTSSVIYSRALSGEAVVGYLAISIPFIAWAALKRMENFGTALVGTVRSAGGVVGSTAGATGQHVAGQRRWTRCSLRPIARRRSWAVGNTISAATPSHRMRSPARFAVSLLRNQGFASGWFRCVCLNRMYRTPAGRWMPRAAKAVAASNERSSVLAEAFTRGGGQAALFPQQHRLDVEQLRAVRRDAQPVRCNKQKASPTPLGLLNLRSHASRFARQATWASVHLWLGCMGRRWRTRTIHQGLSAAELKALSSLSSDQLQEFKQFGDRASRDSSFMNVISNDAREAQDLSARMSTTAARSNRADASLAERSAFAERVSTAYERGETISIDIAQDPHNLAMFTPLRRAVPGQ